jgi:hypothetical protein
VLGQVTGAAELRGQLQQLLARLEDDERDRRMLERLDAIRLLEAAQRRAAVSISRGRTRSTPGHSGSTGSTWTGWCRKRRPLASGSGPCGSSSPWRWTIGPSRA